MAILTVATDILTILRSPRTVALQDEWIGTYDDTSSALPTVLLLLKLLLVLHLLQLGVVLLNLLVVLLLLLLVLILRRRTCHPLLGLIISAESTPPKQTTEHFAELVEQTILTRITSATTAVYSAISILTIKSCVRLIVGWWLNRRSFRACTR